MSIEMRLIPVAPNDDYRAGSDGKIYSRTQYAGFGRKGYVDWYPLVGHETGKGYRSISMCHAGKKVTKNVHRLVCMAFHGMPSSPSMQVRHLDGNPSNNIPTNLCWGTQEENWADRELHGNGMKGEKHHAAKFSNEERARIRWVIKNGLCSQRHAARVLKVTPACIYAITHSKSV